MSFKPNHHTWNRRRAAEAAAQSVGRAVRRAHKPPEGTSMSQDNTRAQERARAVRELKLLGVKLAICLVFALFLYACTLYVGKTLGHHHAAPEQQMEQEQPLK